MEKRLEKLAKNMTGDQLQEAVHFFQKELRGRMPSNINYEIPSGMTIDAFKKDLKKLHAKKIIDGTQLSRLKRATLALCVYFIQKMKVETSPLDMPIQELKKYVLETSHDEMLDAQNLGPDSLTALELFFGKKV